MLTYGETYSILNELSFLVAALAQLVERRLGKAEVGGSSPLGSLNEREARMDY